jgi:hypothetical protein
MYNYLRPSYLTLLLHETTACSAKREKCRKIEGESNEN